jgi:hypothetical protein
MNQKTINSMKLLFSVATISALVFDGVGAEVSRPAGPAKVEVRNLGGHWKLLVNGKPFFIKGAGLEFGDQEKLAAAGGNSFRTWRPDNARETGQQTLDRALKNGLYVTMGLDVARSRHGFDYNDDQAVAKQLREIKAQVVKYKDHPALLMWDIGNELNLDSHNPKVWNAVNDISKMIHQVDPNHPTTTSIAGISKDLVDQIKIRAPDLDLLSVQSYADIVNLPKRLRESGWDGPYAVTEWGATGHWECGKTDWGAPIEDGSSVKADFYKKRYEIAVASDKTQCLGSYVFLWAQKQERTPTWYGLFLASGEATESVDVMQYLWTGNWPKQRCPQIAGVSLDGKSAAQNIRLRAAQTYEAAINAKSLSANSLNYTWEIMEESSAKTTGGDAESVPRKLPGLVVSGSPGRAQITAPEKPGAYRLFAYVREGQDKAAYANIPFYVEPKAPAVATGQN